MGPVIVVQGGAGDIPDGRVQGKLSGVAAAAGAGRRVLEAGGSALDAVEAAVRTMELDENFNAGYGSVLTSEGRVEMEAAVMEGARLGAGAVTLLDNVPHPVSAARLVMERTRHVLLGGDGARAVVREHALPECRPSDLVTEWARRALQPDGAAEGRTEVGGTCGAVAVDARGDVAAATSTGGMSGKLPGRIGDTPQLGAGTYADNDTAAVSATGHGDAILRWGVAMRVCLAVGAGEPAPTAARRVLDQMTARLGHTAGLVAVTPAGDVAVHHTSPRMAWAYTRPQHPHMHLGIEQGQHDILPYCSK